MDDDAGRTRVSQFQQQGYLVEPGLLDNRQVTEVRAKIQGLAGLGDDDYRTKQFTCPDGISKNAQFWPLIFHERLLTIVRELIGTTARYTQHSDLHAHLTGGWHRDSACREFGVGPDWNDELGEYSMLRVAIYLQSFEESGSMLGVLPGSHRYEQSLSPSEQRYWHRRDRLKRLFRKPKPNNEQPQPPAIRTSHGIPFWTPPISPVWIKTEPGDCVVFDQRLYHSSSRICGPKYAAFLSFGAENEHSRNHLRYYLHYRTDLHYEPLDPELVKQLKSAELYLTTPAKAEIPEFTRI